LLNKIIDADSEMYVRLAAAPTATVPNLSNLEEEASVELDAVESAAAAGPEASEGILLLQVPGAVEVSEAVLSSTDDINGVVSLSSRPMKFEIG
jgi:hypothetical protein